MVAIAATMLVFLLFALAVPVGIWLLTERETDDETTVDRESAERSARSDGTGRHGQHDDGW